MRRSGLESNPFYIDTPSIAPGLNAIGEMGEIYKNKKDAEAKSSIRRQAGEYFGSENTEGLSQLMIENPWLTKDMDTVYDFKNEATKNNAVEYASKVLSINDPDRVEDTLLERAKVIIDNDGDPTETLYLAKMASEGDIQPAHNEATRLLAIYNPGALKALAGDEEDGNKPTPTDIDDFVERANQQSIIDTGKALTPGQMNQAALAFKREQAPEAWATRYAERNVDEITAKNINRNADLGKAAAEIETVGDVLKARGEITPVQKKENAKKGVTTKLGSLIKYYSRLKNMGAIQSIENGTMDNIIASTKSSSAGQLFGKIVGSKEQSVRNKINQVKPLLLQDIRQSTDMGARGLDSEKELEFYLQAATNEKIDIESNMAAIYVLDKSYGKGEVAKLLEGEVDKDYVRYFEKQGERILNGGKKTEKPDQKTSEGKTATNPKTGEKLIFRNGQWEPI